MKMNKCAQRLALRAFDEEGSIPGKTNIGNDIFEIGSSLGVPHV